MKRFSRVLIAALFIISVLYFQNCGSGFSATKIDQSSLIDSVDNGSAYSGSTSMPSATPLIPQRLTPAPIPTEQTPSASPALEATPIPTPTATSPPPHSTSTPSPTPFVPAANGLRSSIHNGFLFGTAVATSHLVDQSEPIYKSTIINQFNLMTPENEMKWASVHPQQSTYDFSAGDVIADAANQYGLKIHGHNLAWHAYNPGWLVNGNFTALQLSLILKSHIASVVGHYRTKYPGVVVAWDVVNEAIDDPTDSNVPGLRQSIWTGIGAPDDYIKVAFKAARAADPDAILYYNDYSNDFAGPKATATFNLVSTLKAAGVPIDAVGLQAHIGLGSHISSKAELMGIIAQYAAIGIKVSVTEFDMSLPLSNGAVSAASLALQTSSYHDYLAACVSSPNCLSFSVWGVSDKYSWIPSTFAEFGSPLIFDENYQGKLNVFPIVYQVLTKGN